MKSSKKGFKCKNCNRYVSFSDYIGTKNRNHCPYCLYSTDIDINSGDRKSFCKGSMKPIGLTFKHEGKDKYGKQRQGELMIIHECLKCQKISINRIAGDDNPDAIFDVFNKSKKIEKSQIKELKGNEINVLSLKDEQEIKNQLFGKI